MLPFDTCHAVFETIKVPACALLSFSVQSQFLSERQALMTRLLDAVKQCQIRFGGRSELATENDSRWVHVLDLI